MDREKTRRELEQLRLRMQQIETELAEEPREWPPKTYYAAYYATTGALLGFVGAMTSLLFNIVGSVLLPALAGRRSTRCD